MSFQTSSILLGFENGEGDEEEEEEEEDEEEVEEDIEDIKKQFLFLLLL